MPIPFPTAIRKPPDRAVPAPEQPTGTQLVSENPNVSEVPAENPSNTALQAGTPPESAVKTETPDVSGEKTEMPTDVNEENCVTVGGRKIEITPTKTKYFRNKTASAYGYLKQIPLTEFFSYGKGAFPNDTRDADQILYDFLVAVFDDRNFVRDNYNEITADEIDRIVKIFGRINHIDEKEEAARKNREAQAKR